MNRRLPSSRSAERPRAARRELGRAAAVLAAAALGAACAEQADTPTPPDVSALLAAYASPSAPLSGAVVSEVLPRLTDAKREAEELGHFDFLRSAIEKARDQLDELDKTREETPLGALGAISGHATVTTRCPGWTAGSPEAPRGTAALTAVLEPDRLAKTLWGPATDCHLDPSGVRVALDGSLSVTLLGDTRYGAAHEGDMLFAFDGTRSTFDALSASPWTLDFLIGPEGALDIHLDTAESGAVVYVRDDVEGTEGFRAANGTFDCDFGARRCESATGENEEITW